MFKLLGRCSASVTGSGSSNSKNTGPVIHDHGKTPCRLPPATSPRGYQELMEVHQAGDGSNFFFSKGFCPEDLFSAVKDVDTCFFFWSGEPGLPCQGSPVAATSNTIRAKWLQSTGAMEILVLQYVTKLPDWDTLASKPRSCGGRRYSLPGSVLICCLILAKAIIPSMSLCHCRPRIILKFSRKKDHPLTASH